MKEITLEDIKASIKEYTPKMSVWLANNRLTDLLDFEKYRDSDTWGNSYVKDQRYYEKVSDIKNTYNAYKTILLQMKADSTTLSTKGIDAAVTLVEAEYWRIETVLETARRRIAFYQQITYVLGNVSYGLM